MPRCCKYVHLLPGAPTVHVRAEQSLSDRLVPNPIQLAPVQSELPFDEI